MNVDNKDTTSSKELMNVAAKMEKKYKNIGEDNEEELEVAWDDVSGATLSPQEVKRARAEEIKYVREMKLYKKVPISECYSKTGKAPITTRWIDINKGDVEQPHYRSRLVDREVNTYKRDDLFAATRPFEALVLILFMAAIANKGETIMVNDISRSFFHARAKREAFIQLPPEDTKAGQEDMRVRLQCSMYGTRDAAQNCYEEYLQQFAQIGFRQGLASPCVFYHPERGIRTYVHGAD